jgi:hypothetical protein
VGGEERESVWVEWCADACPASSKVLTNLVILSKENTMTNKSFYAYLISKEIHRIIIVSIFLDVLDTFLKKNMALFLESYLHIGTRI